MNASVEFVEACIKLASEHGVRGYVIAATSVDPSDLLRIQRRIAIGSPRHGETKIASSDAAMIVGDVLRWATEHPEVMQLVRAYLADGHDDVFDGAARS